MEIIELVKRPNIEQDKKLTTRYAYFDKLIVELNKKEIPSEVVKSINQDIEEVNSFSGSDKALLKQLRRVQTSIFKLVWLLAQEWTKKHLKTEGSLTWK